MRFTTPKAASGAPKYGEELCGVRKELSTKRAKCNFPDVYASRTVLPVFHGMQTQWHFEQGIAWLKRPVCSAHEKILLSSTVIKQAAHSWSNKPVYPEQHSGAAAPSARALCKYARRKPRFVHKLYINEYLCNKCLLKVRLADGRPESVPHLAPWVHLHHQRKAASEASRPWKTD